MQTWQKCLTHNAPNLFEPGNTLEIEYGPRGGLRGATGGGESYSASTVRTLLSKGAIDESGAVTPHGILLAQDALRGD